MSVSVRTFDRYDQKRYNRIDFIATGEQQILNALPCVHLVRMLCLRKSYTAWVYTHNLANTIRSTNVFLFTVKK